MLTGDYRSRIDSVWDMFWAGGVTNPMRVIEQITNLLFLCILDTPGRTRPDGSPLFDAAHADCRWSHLTQLPPEEMDAALRDKVFPFLRTALPGETLYGRVMQDAVYAVPTPRILAKTAAVLDSLDLHDRDVMGDVYEYLLSRLSVSGTNGQFRTPRHIIKMMVRLMEPTLEDDICDPAMGTAGFICAAAEYVQEKYRNELLNTENRRHFVSDMFTGFDTDQTMLRIGAMNMMLHNVEAPQITWLDSLSEDNTHRDCYSLIMANPPFTGSLDKSSIAKDLTNLTKTTKTELLFLALFLKSLRMGGRCACIVPDGVLFGSSNAHKSIRKAIVEDNRLQAVISMPSGVFKPYAGVSTAILVFTNTGGNGGTDKVWFYDMKADGYSLDDKRSPIEANDIPDILSRFHNLKDEENRERTEQSFFVPKDEIVGNDYDLSINKYKKVEYTPVEYPPTSEILANLRELEKQISLEMDELEKLLSA